MELKFKEEIDEKNYGKPNEDGVRIKPFYTFDEKVQVFDRIKAQNNAFMRDYALIVETAKACTNIDFTDVKDSDIYDYCASHMLITGFSDLVCEYDKMLSLVAMDETIEKQAERLVDIIDREIPKFTKNFNKQLKGIKIDEVMANFKTVLEKSK